MKKRILAGLTLALTLLLPAAAIADPALWVVRDADTTIYLFGTVHLLPNDVGWRYAALDHALADSKTLYIELIDDDQATVAALVLKEGMDSPHPLSSLLDSADTLRLQQAASKAGVPGGMQTLEVMRPWLAALSIAAAPLLKAGLDPEHGVDKQLKVQMTEAGKPVLGLETAAQQIGFLADMPQRVQLAMLHSTLRDFDKAPIELTQLITAWKTGDVATIARLEDEDMRQQEPALYQRLLVQRNEDWAAKIEGLPQHEKGSIFVAVGAAHLAGPDSVQAQLRKYGVLVHRQ